MVTAETNVTHGLDVLGFLGFGRAVALHTWLGMTETTNSTVSNGAWINPDSRPVLRLVVTVTTLLALVSFAVSFAGLVAVAQWAAIPSWLAWALPVFIDGAIIVYTLAMLVFRARGASTAFAWSALLAFTGVSVAANAAHVYAEGDPSDWRTWVGASLAGLAPAGVAVATHTLAGLTVRPPITADDPSSEALEVPVVTTEHPARPMTELAGTQEDGSALASRWLDEPLLPVLPQNRERNELIVASSTHAPSVTLPVTDQSESTRGYPEVAADALIAKARDLQKQGMSHQAIATELGRSKSTIGRWLKQDSARAQRASESID